MNEQRSTIIREIDALKTSLRLKEQELKEQDLAAIKEQYGIDIGTIVLYHSKRHRISWIDPHLWNHDKPWVKGNPQKKDGTYGIAERALYSYWEKV